MSCEDILLDEGRGDEDSDEEEAGIKCITLLSSLLPEGSLLQYRSISPALEAQENRAAVATVPEVCAASDRNPNLPHIITSPEKILQSEEILEEEHLDEMASSGCPPSLTSSGCPLASSACQVTVRPRPQVPPKPPIDTVRYSMNNIKESNEWELDALLDELSALETQLNSSNGDQLLLGLPSIRSTTSNDRIKQIEPARLPTHSAVPSQHTVGTSAHSPVTSPIQHVTSSHQAVTSSHQSVTSLQQNVTSSHQTVASSCSSPDGDSAFGDTSSTESRNRNSAFSSNDSCRDSLHTPSPTQISPRTAEPTAEEIKAAKIKQALEKMKEAKVTRIFVKFFVEDGDPLQMLVDERWTVAETMQQLVDKHQMTLAEDHCIVEEFPDMYIRRIYEDHENLVENIQMWLQDSGNKLYFVRRSDKYSFIDRPEVYLVTERTSDIEVPKGETWTREVKQQFVEDYFTRDTVSPPEMEGILYLKADGRKSWKKHYFVLRPSGLYYAPKGKKTASTKDLQCLMNLHSNQVYTGLTWAKKYKAPTDYCISIKLTQLQVKRSQYIKYICAEDEPTFRKWLVALRIAKNGGALYKNYVAACENRRATLGAQQVSRVSSAMQNPISVNTQPSSCSSSQHDLRIRDKISSPHSPSQLSRVSQMTSLSERSAAHSAVIEYDEQPTGTIKRAPLDVLRRMSQSSSNGRTPSVGTPDDDDSDEDFPAPPPVLTASRTATPTQISTPPPKPAYYSNQAPPTPVRQTPVKMPVSVPAMSPTPGKKIPPPPPKRSEATRVVTAPVPHMNDLEAALARRREKMSQQV